MSDELREDQEEEKELGLVQTEESGYAKRHHNFEEGEEDEGEGAENVEGTANIEGAHNAPNPTNAESGAKPAKAEHHGMFSQMKAQAEAAAHKTAEAAKRAKEEAERHALEVAYS
jgi:hypothetical protein